MSVKVCFVFICQFPNDLFKLLHKKWTPAPLPSFGDFDFLALSLERGVSCCENPHNGQIHNIFFFISLEKCKLMTTQSEKTIAMYGLSPEILYKLRNLFHLLTVVEYSNLTRKFINSHYRTRKMPLSQKVALAQRQLVATERGHQ